ncbi:496_t:CDS:2 [Funneliformis mosseae]|uniref:496_t:CDS:1 n=1 Tax=Funneliformis mosseae TaxID=27381 RepID=A0A9N9D1S9_FUNMO|nr:496_t:CDS:2 [Funneliformis mosseae]
MLKLQKVAEICSKTGVVEKTAKSQVYAIIKASLPNVSNSNLYKKTERAGCIYKLFRKIIDPATKKEVMEIGIDKACRISYGIRGISELSDAQILNIINRVAEKARDILTNGQEQNHVTEISKKILPIPEENLSLSADVDGYINMLTGSLDDETDNWGTPYENSARIGKEEANEVKLEDEVPPRPENVTSDSSGDSKGISPDDLPKSQVSIPSTSFSDQISKSNRFRLLVSILPEDPEEKRKHIIGLVLEKFPYLSLDDSDKCRDTFNLDGSTLCPLCNGDHKVNRSIFDEIKGEWGDGEYYGERTYRLICRISYKPGIPVVSIKA